MSSIIKDMIVNYTGVNRTAEHTWDYIQKSVRRHYSVPIFRNHFSNRPNWPVRMTVSVIYSPGMTDQAALYRSLENKTALYVTYLP